MRSERGKNVSLVLIGLGVFLILLDIFLASIGDYLPFGILTSVGLLFFIIGSVGLIVYNKRNVNAGSYDELSNIDIYDAKVIGVKEGNKTKVSIKYLFLQTEAPEGAVCRITKIPLEDKEDILQCPNCKSYFQGIYLREWVYDKETCPVCKFILKITKKDKPRITF